MAMRTLRKHLMKMGGWAAMLGVILSVGGLWFGNPVVIAVGCVSLFGGAYAMVYAQVGSL
jgi:hypothetical protein